MLNSHLAFQPFFLSIKNKLKSHLVYEVHAICFMVDTGLNFIEEV